MSAQVYVATQALSGVATVREGLDRLQKLGITRVELSGPHRLPDPAIETALPGRGLSYVLHNYFPAPRDAFFLNLASPDPSIAQRSIQHAKNAIELASRIGAPLYTIHGGFRVDPTLTLDFHVTPEMPSRADSLARYIENLLPVVAHAERHGVQLGVENNVLDPRNLAKSPDDPFLLFLDETDFLELFRAIRSPALGALIDVGHLHVTARSVGFSPERVLTKLADRVHALHIHDNDGTRDAHLPPTPESWFMPWIANGPLSRATRILEAERLDEATLLRSVRLLESWPEVAS